MKTTPAVFASLALMAVTLAAPLRAGDRPIPSPTPNDPAREKMVKRLNHIVLPAAHMIVAKFEDAATFYTSKVADIDAQADNPPPPLKITVKDDSGRLAAMRVTYSASAIPFSELLRYSAEQTGSKLVVDAQGVTFVPLDGYQGGVPPWVQPSLLPVGAQEEGCKRVQAKLDNIVIPQISFRKATLRDALDYAHRKSIELDTVETDPSKKGVSVVLMEYPAPENDNTPAPGDTQISLEAADMSLDAALKEIARLSGMKMTVEPHAVVFHPDVQQQQEQK